MFQKWAHLIDKLILLIFQIETKMNRFLRLVIDFKYW
jgi:hypothetical protein